VEFVVASPNISVDAAGVCAADAGELGSADADAAGVEDPGAADVAGVVDESGEVDVAPVVLFALFALSCAACNSVQSIVWFQLLSIELRGGLTPGAYAAANSAPLSMPF